MKVVRQPDCQDMPEFAVPHRTGVNLGAEDGGEARRAKGFGPGYGIAVDAYEMIGQSQEVIAFGAVTPADFLRVKTAV